MAIINIQFIAYIPKSLGKSLVSYFKADPRFNPKYMVNYNDFKSKLEALDRNYRWLPEPGVSMTNCYFAPDNVNIHNLHSSHTVRLAVNMNIDSNRIGKFTLADASSIFKHPSGSSGQYSDTSHRVKAFIETVPLDHRRTMGPTSQTFSIFKGVCGNIETKKSYDNSFVKNIRNAISSTKYYPRRGGSKGILDSTIVGASASAGYPFRSGPNIDFKINAILYRNGGNIDITIDGQHDNFPAYELIINNRVLYIYDPSKKGYTGPNPFNLGVFSTYFNVSERISIR